MFRRPFSEGARIAGRAYQGARPSYPYRPKHFHPTPETGFKGDQHGSRNETNKGNAEDKIKDKDNSIQTPHDLVVKNAIKSYETGRTTYTTEYTRSLMVGALNGMCERNPAIEKAVQELQQTPEQSAIGIVPSPKAIGDKRNITREYPDQRIKDELKSIKPKISNLRKEIYILRRKFKPLDKSSIENEKFQISQLRPKLEEVISDLDKLKRSLDAVVDHSTSKPDESRDNIRRVIEDKAKLYIVKLENRFKEECHKFLVLEFDILEKDECIHYAKENNMELREYKEQKNAKVKDIFENMDNFHRTSIQSLLKILKDGEIKDLIETGKPGSGYPNIIRRKQSNWKLYGKDFEEDKSPVYGYASSHPWGYDPYIGVYKFIVICLDKEKLKKNGVTGTIGDSLALSTHQHNTDDLDGVGSLLVRPTDVNNPDGKCVPLGWGDFVKLDFKKHFHGYVELQYHRYKQRLMLDAIKEVYFLDPSQLVEGHPDKALIEEAIKLLEEKKIPYKIAPNNEFTHVESILVPV